MKRILVVLLCAILVASMMTGCADQKMSQQLIEDIQQVANTPEGAKLFKDLYQSVSGIGVSEGETAEKETDEKETEAEETAEEAKAEDVKSEEAETAKEGKYPIKWNLKDIYQSKADWEKDYKKAEQLVDKLDQFRGKLGTVEGMRDYIKFTYDGDLAKLMNRLGLYPDLMSSLNAADTDALNMTAKMEQLIAKQSEKLAYVDDEIFAIDIDERKKMFEDPLLQPYAYAFSDYLDEDTVHYSEETNIALSKLSPVLGAGFDMYSTLMYADMPYPEIELPDGTTKKLTYENCIDIVGGDYPQDFKKEVSNLYYSAPKQFANSYAKALEYTIKENIANAQLAGYDTYLEYAFDSDDIDPEIYAKMKKASHELLPIFHKSLAARKKISGLDHYYVFNYGEGHKGEKIHISYDDACDTILKVLNVLGDDYTDAAKEVVEKEHVDVYPAEGKNTNGFCCSTSLKEINPYILINYNDDLQSEYALCHEMGHAMYAYFSEHNDDLNFTNKNATIFTHEVASLNNALLLTYYNLKNAKSDSEKEECLRSALRLIETDAIMQMMYSELEEFLYDTVEKGGALDAETISDKWVELCHEYFGDDVELVDNYRYAWAWVPHLHYGFYVYKYATSCAYAAATSEMIRDGKEGALENYRKFLALGGSKEPAELLKVAGVDPFKDETYKYIKDVYSELVDEYIELATKE